MECHQYQKQIQYAATLTGGGLIPITKQIEIGSCSSVCNVLFNIAFLSNGNLLLQLQARNDIGVSNVVEKSVFVNIGKYYCNDA